MDKDKKIRINMQLPGLLFGSALTIIFLQLFANLDISYCSVLEFCVHLFKSLIVYSSLSDLCAILFPFLALCL